MKSKLDTILTLQFKARLFLLAQRILPQHFLSRLLGGVANCRWHWLRMFLIRCFIKAYKIDLSKIKNRDLHSYVNFNQFFIRELAQGFPCSTDVKHLLSPAEGFLSEFGAIIDERLIQAKGHYYGLKALLAGESELVARFVSGHFATIYLAPSNYHRVHLPFAGTLEEIIYVPGKLYSVNLTTTHHIPELFAKNERLIMTFDTVQGKFAVILVGAMLVAGIVNHFVPFSSAEKKTLQKRDLRDLQIQLAQGAELGYFEFGSTVILLMEDKTFKFGFAESQMVALGQKLGEF